MARIAHIVVAAAVLVLAGTGVAAAARGNGPVVTHGVVVGDVTARAAVLWARADRTGFLPVRIAGGGRVHFTQLRVRAEDDYTGQLRLRPLKPDTGYRYSVGPERSAVSGSFRTAPAADAAEPVRLAFGGDVGGLLENGVHVETLVLPDDVHDSLLWRHWRTAASATAEFFERILARD